MMSEKDLIQLTDGYKLDHRRQYPDGTEFVYSNFTARSTRIGGADKVPFVGLDYFNEEYLVRRASVFFNKPVHQVEDEYYTMLADYFGESAANKIGTKHIVELHRLQHIPLEFCALPEGTLVPFKVPMFTVENTLPEFAWLTNYFETLMSSVLWLPCTSAATARRYRKILETYCSLTGGSPAFIDWQGHDFSFRGMCGPEAAALSGLGHLLSFSGTDCLPAINLIKCHYADEHSESVIACSVPATEHSVMCAGGQMDEMATYKRLLNLYPTGVVSVVSDTWDLWRVIREYLPELKYDIMHRDGKLVIRPDSGDPVLILTGDVARKPNTLAHIGVVEALWNIFGGTVNSLGFKELDSHIGTIYGDSITEQRAQLICQRLLDKGFASTNAVYGIGSFTYQYTTRDVNGFAVKATWAQVKGKEHMLFKDPVTDDGGKRSARGRLVVTRNEGGKLELIDGLSRDEQRLYDKVNLLKPVWRNGYRTTSERSWSKMRARVAGVNI